MNYHTKRITDLFDAVGENALYVISNIDPEDLEIESIEDRIEIAKMYNKLGKPEDLHETVTTLLGEKADVYLHPALIKMFMYDLGDLLNLEDDYIKDSIVTNYTPLLQTVLDVKFSEYLTHEGITSLNPRKEVTSDSGTNKSAVFKLVAPYLDRNILQVILSQKGYKYNVTINFLDTTWSTMEDLTEDSAKSIKKFMYEISEYDLDVSHLDQVLQYITLKDLVLDCFMKNLLRHIESSKA
jgi:hypothetical protein